jgi:hypothetical protein
LPKDQVGPTRKDMRPKKVSPCTKVVCPGVTSEALKWNEWSPPKMKGMLPRQQKTEGVLVYIQYKMFCVQYEASGIRSRRLTRTTGLKVAPGMTTLSVSPGLISLVS